MPVHIRLSEMRILRSSRLCLFAALAVLLASAPLPSYATNAGHGAANASAVSTFLLFVLVTLGITWLASKRTRDQDTFFAAGGAIPAWQNGFAIAGDFMSAATLLGITGLMYVAGHDAYLLSTGVMVSWPLMLMVIAERFRNLGKFTFVDVVTFRMQRSSVRLLCAVASLFVVVFYLIGQMVGAGKLIELLFGIDYIIAVCLVTALMMVYVVFGGMIATTWVQMIKAILLLSGGIFVAFLLLKRFDFDFSALLQRSVDIHPKGESLLAPGGWLKSSPAQVLTVGLTMCFGIMGLPHILMRFFTVKDAASARSSVAIATVIMGIFYVAILILGFGAVALVWGNPAFLDDSGSLVGGSNMVALHLAKTVGGEILLGYLSAVTFATILAVVAGLTLAGSAAIAHDLLGAVGKSNDNESRSQLFVTRASALAIGLLALGLGIVFESQNIAVVTTLALAIAASVNFPMLLLAMYWRNLTSSGCLIGGGITLAICVVLIVLGDGVWVQILKNEKAVFPLVYPTLITMPTGFVLIAFFSMLDKSGSAQRERERYARQLYRCETGVGATGAAQH